MTALEDIHTLMQDQGWPILVALVMVLIIALAASFHKDGVFVSLEHSIRTMGRAIRAALGVMERFDWRAFMFFWMRW